RVPVSFPAQAPRWGGRLVPAIVMVALLIPTLVIPSVGQAQVIIIEHNRRLPVRPPVPRPTPIPSSYKIRTVDVQASIRDQAAKVQVSQVFQNTGSTTLEAQFVFPM